MQYFIAVASMILLTLASCKESSRTPPLSKSTIPEIAILDQEIANDPSLPENYFQRGDLYLLHEGYDEAIIDFNKAIKLDSSFRMAWHRLADTYLDYYKSGKALETMERAALHFPKSIATHLKLAEFQLILKRYPDALTTINKIFLMDPVHAEAFFMQGMILKEMGDTTRAITAFQKAVKEDPDLTDAWINISSLLSKQDPESASEYLETAILIQPENEHFLFAKANFMANQNLLIEAIDAYKHLIHIHPDFADAYYNLGLLYLDMDSLPLAYEHFDILSRIEPSYAKAYYYRGLSAELMGNLKMAKSDYEQTLRFLPNFTEAADGMERVKSTMDNPK